VLHNEKSIIDIMQQNSVSLSNAMDPEKDKHRSPSMDNAIEVQESDAQLVDTLDLQAVKHIRLKMDLIILPMLVIMYTFK
jgi:hypothetical protein